MVLYAGNAVPETSGGGGGGASSKYGVTLDSFLGVLNGSGMLQAYSDDIHFVGTGIRDIDQDALRDAFNSKTRLRTISFPDLTTISGNTACYCMCYECTRLTSVDLSSLVTVSGQMAFYQAFYGCDNLTSVNLDNLTEITSNGCTNMFRNCGDLTSIDLSNLTTITGSQSYMFGSTGLKEISFPKLQEVSSDALSNMFYGCKSMKKIHFRADMQATIEALSGYSSKFGASGTIYFDL